MINQRHHQAGAAHLVLVGIIVLVILGALGFVAYNALQRSEVMAGGLWSIGHKAPKGSPAAVTVTFKATDWKNLRSAKVVKDAKHGQVLRITKNGMAADKITFASISASDSRFKQLNDFNTAAYRWGNGDSSKSSYYQVVCANYQRTYTNQDIKKFPWVSTFQTSVGPYSISGDPYTTVWQEKKCKSTRMTPKISGSLKELIASGRMRDKIPNELYTKGFSITTKTTLPDRNPKYTKANPAASGIITIGDFTVTATFDRDYRP